MLLTTHQPKDWRQRFKDCKWFQRGWTLQELIAPLPDRRRFYDKHWRRIDAPYGPISEADINGLIQEKTKIPLNILEGTKALDEVNVASKMRWAVNRQTKREEDIAYSLMGLFGVQMTLQYGEGREKAFIRLQKKILKRTIDQSIFVWEDPRLRLRLGLLAPSPECFGVLDIDYGEMAVHQLGSSDDISAWAITNHGLKASLNIVHGEGKPSGREHAYLGVIDTKSGRMPLLELHQLGGLRYQRGPRLEFRHPPERFGTRERELILPLTNNASPTRFAPPVIIFFDHLSVAQRSRIQVSDEYLGCKWTSVTYKDVAGYDHLICRYPVEEGGYHVASAKIVVLSPPDEENDDDDASLGSPSDAGHRLSAGAPTQATESTYYIHCWLRWVPQSPSKWDVVCHLSDQSERVPPKEGDGLPTIRDGPTVTAGQMRMFKGDHTMPIFYRLRGIPDVMSEISDGSTSPGK